MPVVANDPRLLKLASGQTADLSLDHQQRLRVTVEPFFRLGEPFIIPVGPNTAGQQFLIDVPDNANVFQYTNDNLFSVRLRGFASLNRFVPVTPTTGWRFLPMEKDCRLTLMPVVVSVMSVDSALAAFYPEGKAGTGFIELQYGRNS